MQPNEMYGTAARSMPDYLLPRSGFEYLPGIDCILDQRRTLCKYSTGANGVVPDFAVPHVCIAGQANRFPVRLERGEKSLLREAIESGSIRQRNGICRPGWRDSDAVGNNQ
jgi:hypothetical protein